VERTLEAAEVFCYMSSNRCSLQSSSFDMFVDQERLCQRKGR
jgi:hypothetical protein